MVLMCMHRRHGCRLVAGWLQVDDRPVIWSDGSIALCTLGAGSCFCGFTRLRRQAGVHDAICTSMHAIAYSSPVVMGRHESTL